MFDADVMKDAGLLVWQASHVLKLALSGHPDAVRLASVNLAGLDECAQTLLDRARQLRAGTAK